MNPIRLFFDVFNANQFFSPILGEYKTSKKRLQEFYSDILAQLARKPRISSRHLPIVVNIKFFVSKDNFQPQALLLLSFKILDALKASLIIQDINNHCLAGVSLTTQKSTQEGCEITFSK